MNGYDLTRAWFNYKFDNPGNLRAIHAEMYFYIVDLWNRLGQKEKFGLPTDVTMQALEIGSYKTYKKTFDELVKHNFIIEVSNSQNQYKSRIIALVKSAKATAKPIAKSLDKALIKASAKSPAESSATIDKQETINKKQETINNSLLSEIKISDLEFPISEYFEIALAFRDLFLKNLKEKNSPAAAQKSAKFKNYVDPIRLMMTVDGISKEQLTKVFKFLDSQAGEFWKSNILSTKKLREKFPQLSIQANQNGNRNNTKQRTDSEIKRDVSRAVDKLFGVQ